MRPPRDCGIKKLAETFQCSMATISRALRNKPGVSREKREAICREAERIGFMFTTPGESIRLILPAGMCPLDLYSIQLLNAFREESCTRGLHLQIISANDINFDRFSYQRAILLGSNHSYDDLQLMSTWQYQPMLCINTYGQHRENIYEIISDEAQGITLAMEYLVSCGHRKIVFMYSGSQKNYSNTLRINSFLESVKKNRLRKSECIVTSCDGYEKFWNYIPVLQSLQEQGVTAVINSGESSSLKIHYAIQAIRLRIPEQLSLLCWEVPGISENLYPGLTTLQQDFRQMVSVAFDRLLKIGSPGRFGRQCENPVQTQYTKQCRASVWTGKRMTVFRHQYFRFRSFLP